MQQPTRGSIIDDPYNWPFPKRSDLMALQSVSKPASQHKVEIGDASFALIDRFSDQRDVGFPKFVVQQPQTRAFDLSDIRG